MYILKTALLAAPLAFFGGALLAILTSRFWGWFEAKTGIESLGHSGPADWVFFFCWGFTFVVAFAALYFRKKDR